MNLSKKIILASCACAAFLTGVYSCTVEERDIEEKDLFLCMVDADCLNSSVCVGANQETGVAGRCRLKNQVEACADHDGDTFLAMDAKYKEILQEKGGEGGNFTDNCGSESHPKDIDDTDPDVYPGATEYCDGKDNNGDGCVDGKCMCDAATDNSCDCEHNQNLCAALTENCIGRRNLSEMVSSKCSAKVAGALFCRPTTDANNHKKGEWVYGKAESPTGSHGDKKFYTISDFKEVDGQTTCPQKTNSDDLSVTIYNLGSETFGFVESELRLLNGNKSTIGDINLCDGDDHDCNGTPGAQEVPDKCKSCEDVLAEFSNDQRECRVFYYSGLWDIPHYTKPGVEHTDWTTADEVYNHGEVAAKPCNNPNNNCPCIYSRSCDNDKHTPDCLYNNNQAAFEAHMAELGKTNIDYTQDGWCEITSE